MALPICNRLGEAHPPPICTRMAVRLGSMLSCERGVRENEKTMAGEYAIGEKAMAEENAMAGYLKKAPLRRP